MVSQMRANAHDAAGVTRNQNSRILYMYEQGEYMFN